jgi:feruloyl esterase
VFAMGLWQAGGAAPQSCERLQQLTTRAHVTITHAQSHPGGEFSPPGSTAPLRELPGFCRVAATSKPSADSEIQIEVWMPVSGWNGKFLAVGNGAWAGTIGYGAMATALRRGYATSSTDTGHSGNSGRFALGHPEKVIDFGYRAPHEMTVTAKAIVSAFYGAGPRHSYWNGCSTGGRQALVAAQRFPEDFDGIIAGAAANPKTHMDGWRLWMAQQTLRDPARAIPAATYPIIHRAVLASCDAIDGVKDGLIEDPTRCRFDASTLSCAQGAGPDCLTAKQVESVRTIMGPARSERSGIELFPGYEPGTELEWGRLLGGPEAYGIAVEMFKYVVFNDPDWDWRTFDLDRDVTRANSAASGALAGVDPNLQPFFGRGGKLLMYHGWSDERIAPRASVNFYENVAKALGGVEKIANDMRLYMVPGMGHCGGGEGPNTFDMLTALEQWIEAGRAPSRIIASRGARGAVSRTRPLCPYPQVARYLGAGSIDEAANFACRSR